MIGQAFAGSDASIFYLLIFLSVKAQTQRYKQAILSLKNTTEDFMELKRFYKTLVCFLKTDPYGCVWWFVCGS